MSGAEYSPTYYFMEYREPFFPGLYEAARGATFQSVTIDGLIYYTRSALRLSDGETIQIHLERVESPMP